MPWSGCRCPGTSPAGRGEGTKGRGRSSVLWVLRCCPTSQTADPLAQRRMPEAEGSCPGKQGRRPTPWAHEEVVTRGLTTGHRHRTHAQSTSPGYQDAGPRPRTVTPAPGASATGAWMQLHMLHAVSTCVAAPPTSRVGHPPYTQTHVCTHAQACTDMHPHAEQGYSLF